LGLSRKTIPPAAKAETVFDMLTGTAESRALSKPLLFKIPNPNAFALREVPSDGGDLNHRGR